MKLPRHHHSTSNGKHHDWADEVVNPDGTGTLSHATTSEDHGTWDSDGTSSGPGYFDTWWDTHDWNSDSAYSANADIFDHEQTRLTSYTNSSNSDYDSQGHSHGNSWGGGATHAYSNDWHNWGDSIWQEAYDEPSQSNKGSHTWADHGTAYGWWSSTWTDADGNTEGDGGSYSDAWDSGDTSSWQDPIDPLNWVGQRPYASSGWSIAGSAFASMVGDLEHEFQQMVADARAYAANPGVFVETARNDASEHSIDAAAGFVDGLLESLNPISFWWEVPDIGPIYGHTDAYAAGNIAGMATGIVGTVLLTGGSGLAVCGTKLGMLAKAYNVVNNIAGAAAAAHASVNIASGNGTLKDGLALTGFLPTSGPKCFTPDDHDTIGAELVYPPHTSSVAISGIPRALNWLGGGVLVVGVFGWQAWELRNRRRKREEEALLDRALAEWMGSDSDDPMTEDEEDPALALACRRVSALSAGERGAASVWDETLLDDMRPGDEGGSADSLRSLRLCVRHPSAFRERRPQSSPLISRRVAETAEEVLPRPSVKPLPKAPPTRPRFASVGRWCLAICALISLGLWFSANRIADNEAEANAHAAIAANEPYWRLFRQPFGEVRGGGYVLSADPISAELTPKPVVQEFRSQADHLRIVEFETADGQQQVLRTTDEHPFWVPDLTADVKAGDLAIGQQVQSPDGTLQTVVSTLREEHPNGVEVANFEVADFHRYFVIAKEGNGVPILVHNAECVRWIDDVPNMGQAARRFEDAATGARSNVLSKLRQVPVIDRTLANFTKKGVKFDGLDGTTLIDRKTAITLFQKSKDQALGRAKK